MQWQAIGCSEIGSGHIKTGTPCQDFCEYRIITNHQVTIGAVSDGMGSASHADLGSKIAVQTAMSCLGQRDWLNHSLDEGQARVFFGNLLKTVVTEIQTVAKTQSASVRDFACTLLAFIATPHFLAAMQVGDGLIVIRPKSSQSYHLLFKPQKGEHANEYVPITSTAASQEMQVKVIHEPIDFICAATDGIENISLIKAQNWQPFHKFFEPLETEVMRSNKTEREKLILLENWLKSEDMNTRTDDDKTVLLCIQSQGKYSSPVDKIQSANAGQESSPLKHGPELGVTAEPSIDSHPPEFIQEIKKIKQDIYDLYSEENSNFQLKIKFIKKTLIISVISFQEINQGDFLGLIESLTFNSYKLPIKKIKIYNQIQNSSNHYKYWEEEFKVEGVSFSIAKFWHLIFYALVMTLFSVVINVLTNGLLLTTVAYFLYSLILLIIIDIFAAQNR